MRAINWPFLTSLLKSANSSLIWPETCEPTETETTGLRMPVAATVAISGPFSTFALRNFCASSFAPNCFQPTQPPAPSTATIASHPNLPRTPIAPPLTAPTPEAEL